MATDQAAVFDGGGGALFLYYMWDAPPVITSVLCQGSKSTFISSERQWLLFYYVIVS